MVSLVQVSQYTVISAWNSMVTPAVKWFVNRDIMTTNKLPGMYWTEIWWEAPMEGSVLIFLKAEWKVSDTGSAHWASSSYAWKATKKEKRMQKRNEQSL
jgi:hypothetical protein